MTFFRNGLVLLCMMALLGCSKVSQDNFDRVKPGMNKQEVIRILGKPTSEGGVAIGGLSGTSAVWESKKGSITIVFLNDQVKVKSFSNDKTFDLKAGDGQSTDLTQDQKPKDSQTQDSQSQ